MIKTGRAECIRKTGVTNHKEKFFQTGELAGSKKNQQEGSRDHCENGPFRGGGFAEKQKQSRADGKHQRCRVHGFHGDDCIGRGEQQQDGNIPVDIQYFCGFFEAEYGRRHHEECFQECQNQDIFAEQRQHGKKALTEIQPRKRKISGIRIEGIPSKTHTAFADTPRHGTGEKQGQNHCRYDKCSQGSDMRDFQSGGEEEAFQGIAGAVHEKAAEAAQDDKQKNARNTVVHAEEFAQRERGGAGKSFAVLPNCVKSQRSFQNGGSVRVKQMRISGGIQRGRVGLRSHGCIAGYGKHIHEGNENRQKEKPASFRAFQQCGESQNRPRRERGNHVSRHRGCTAVPAIEKGIHRQKKKYGPRTKQGNLSVEAAAFPHRRETGERKHKKGHHQQNAAFHTDEEFRRNPRGNHAGHAVSFVNRIDELRGE